MTRFIEIFCDNDIDLLTTDELPLVVNLDEDTHKKITISNINESENLVQIIQCAYIAEDDGHLFFQPDISSSEQSDIKIFHNDELIKKSVWIKSGDVIRIENKIIIFQISGDRIEIRIVESKEATLLSPPPIEELIVIKSQVSSEAHNELPDISKNNEEEKAQLKSSAKTKNILILLLILLTTIAGFILIAETANITIVPETDQVELKGVVPAVKLGHRYIVISGKYQLTARKEGYKPLNKIIYIDSENAFFAFQMQETPGLVEFNIEPKTNNEIYLNDRLLGNTLNSQEKLIQYEVDKGEYVLKVTNSRYKTYTQAIKIEGKNIVQSFSFVLQPNWGEVKITSKPENAVIEINKLTSEEDKQPEIKKFNTPVEIELNAGEYELSIRKEKYKSKKMPFKVNAGEKINLGTIELETQDAQIMLATVPMGGIVRIDGQYYGKTPTTITLPAIVEHQIEISLSGYETKKDTVTLEPGAVNKLNYNLKEVSGSVFISSSPTQAKLYINGILQKNSSGKFFLKGKNNTLTVKAQGYKTRTKKIDAGSYSKNISILLKKIQSNKAVKKASQTEKTPTAVKSKENYINSIGQKMILMKPTVFTMGSTKNDIGRRSNEPQHQVKLTQAFYLSDKEISNKQFRQFNPAHNSGFSSGQSLDNATKPVVNISWNDAAKFANWLSKKEGLSPYYKELKGNMIPDSLTTQVDGYRLPFEAEWEYAARGNNNKKYPWLGSYPPKIAYGNFADKSASKQLVQIIDGYNDGYNVSAPVGSYKANQFGFYDMGGNVSEWCQDYYVPYSSSGSLATNPVGPEKGIHKVVRDSSWKDSSITELRLSYRAYSKKAMNDIGFRIARSALLPGKE